MTSRRARREDRAFRAQLLTAVAVLAAIGGLLVLIAPAWHERPLVTVYMKPDCDSCRRWTRHLHASGFRIQAGLEEEWTAVRRRVRIPPEFDAPHHAIVQGLFIAGYVPARDIHRALSSPERQAIRGLLLPGAPPGAPGIETALKQPYVVFAMDANGLLRQWATHNHLDH
jgi:hypothetical protein